MNKIRSLVFIALLVFALDQWSKWYLLEVVDIQTRAPIVLSDYFSLVMAWNRGVSFSMFSHHAASMPRLLIAVALVICLILGRLCLRSTDSVERFSYAIIIGGAMGNAFDRVRFGAVADFFYAHIGDLGWPAFNVADSAICLGVGVLLLRMTRQKETHSSP